MKQTKKTTTKTEKKELASPKGMRDIMNDEYYAFQGFFEKAQEVAVYYGFKPLQTPILESEEIFSRGVGEGTDIVDKEMYTLKTKGGDHLAMRPELTGGQMRAYIEHGMHTLPQPVLLYKFGPSFRHDNPQKGRYREFRQFDLDALGSPKSIMDALVIKAGMSILEDAGAKNLSIDINSIGDKECRNGYLKELTNYYKKNISVLSAIDRERLKTNPLRILDSKDPKTQEINQGAPDSVSFLCSSCKKHFKEVLEYLEEMDIPYNLNKNLVRGLSYYTRTVFEVVTEETNEGGETRSVSVAGGGRYDYLAKTIGGKKDVPAVGFSIGVDRIIEASWYKKLAPRIMKKPKICFIQLGVEAKLKSLNVIDILRKAHIPITQSLSRDSLGSQLAIAEKLSVPCAIIFGVKEAIENSVIVRNMETRSQETVKIENLLEYLKELK
ncbi:MAG: histidine--tRNA ligase [Candidatus Pacebacteria bacterium]|nr:histidine--tRNA ligase [Candidatus Paceibacterota bacterium]MCF7862826.1 histidine--tRNA ligase [Candidatus Paceibacterota bacterium]